MLFPFLSMRNRPNVCHFPPTSCIVTPRSSFNLHNNQPVPLIRHEWFWRPAPVRCVGSTGECLWWFVVDPPKQGNAGCAGVALFDSVGRGLHAGGYLY